MIDYRILHTVPELRAVEQLEIVVWGLNPLDAVPMYIMHAAAENGGVTLGAYDGEQMVGMAFGFAAKRGAEVFFWSHMAGVHPAYQGRGVGYELKQRQRAWALEQGYEIIRWTFDPLQRGNAHFNIALLGATVSVYHENFYGDMDDDINRGLPSDRVEAAWKLRQPQGKAHTGRVPPALLQAADDVHLALNLPSQWQEAAYFVPLPRASWSSIETHTLRLTWRMGVRAALQTAFAQGYTAAGFHKEANGYIVEKRSNA
ncbi:MAG: GNAT family N-acetyltransferase [Chloroflexi bacterium]|nr:GNAT family N-acetyltransferase [Chloroflexota bacterium]